MSPIITKEKFFALAKIYGFTVERATSLWESRPEDDDSTEEQVEKMLRLIQTLGDKKCSHAGLCNDKIVGIITKAALTLVPVEVMRLLATREGDPGLNLGEFLKENNLSEVQYEAARMVSAIAMSLSDVNLFSGLSMTINDWVQFNLLNNSAFDHFMKDTKPPSGGFVH